MATTHTHVIEVLRGFHDVGGPLVLLQFHPALSEEFPAGDGRGPQDGGGECKVVLLIPLLLRLSFGGVEGGEAGIRPTHSLVRDLLEDQVVQQGQLLRNLQGRVALKGFGLHARGLRGAGPS